MKRKKWSAGTASCSSGGDDGGGGKSVLCLEGLSVFYGDGVKAFPGRSKYTMKFATLCNRGVYVKYGGGGHRGHFSAECDSSPSERLTPALVGYGINTLFYVGRQRSMDLPFPERKHSIFSG